MKRILQISNLVSLLAAIGINYAVNSSETGSTIGEVSARYANLLTPADYAFSIWGIIYLALLAFGIYQALSLFKRDAADDFVAKISGWFVISSLANAAWSVAFINDQVGLSMLIMGVLFFSLLKIVENLKMEKWDAPVSRVVFVWWPIGLYFGWITVALVANISAYLTKLGWGGAPLTPQVWAILILVVLGLVLTSMIWGRNMREYTLSAVWGIIAIAVANWEAHLPVGVTAVVVAGIVIINAALHGYKNRRQSILAARTP
jgi:hypothetical protein